MELIALIFTLVGAGELGPLVEVRRPVQLANPQAIVRLRIPACEGGKCYVGWGSGVLVETYTDGTGLILTCGHNLRGYAGQGGKVCYANDTAGEFVTQYHDEAGELAVLWAWVPPGLEPIPVAERNLAAGDSVTVAGYGSDGRLFPQASRVLRFSTDGQPIMGPSRARQGDSGGPVINAAGQVASVLWGQYEETYGCRPRPLRDLLARIRAKLGREPKPSRPPANEPVETPAAASAESGPPSAAAIPPAAPDSRPEPAEPSEPTSQGPGLLSGLFSGMVDRFGVWALTSVGLSPPAAAGAWLIFKFIRRKRKARKDVRSELEAPPGGGRRDAGRQDGAGGREAAPPPVCTCCHHPKEDAPATAPTFPRLDDRSDVEGRQLVQLHALEGRNPLHDATLGRVLTQELERVAHGQDEVAARLATDVLRVATERFNSIHPIAIKFPQTTSAGA